jgi:hypothetical protein
MGSDKTKVLQAEEARSIEADRILAMCKGDLLQAIGVLERQFNTLHARAQVLFSFCGIVITVTGFSGRLIAGTNRPAQFFIVGGLAVVVACAFYIYHNVMTLRWTTQRLLDCPEETILKGLERRDLKTNSYRRGGYILFLGLVLYSASIAIMLLNPVPLEVPVR